MQVNVGQKIAERYIIEEYLGRGGMAEVYKVWDQQRTAHLALKMMHEDLAEDKIFLRRFKREAETLARLQHPHIVRFYGLESSQYQVFMLMDYIEGETLRRQIFRKEGFYTTTEVAGIIQPLCSALNYAHNLGLIHCDIKPGNVMINQHQQVLLADFGIARFADSATMTMVGAGTPAYMAPEQVKGLDPIPQTDIYALGVILYEMLTGGERPFTGDTATTTGTTSAKVRWEQVNLDPPSPRLYQPDISPDLERIVLKCLSKEPKNRYQNTVDLLNELETVIQKVSESPRRAIDSKLEQVTPYIPPKSPVDPVQPEQSRIQPVRKESKPKRPLWGIWVGVASVVALGVIFGSGITKPKPSEMIVINGTKPKPTERIVLTATNTAATSTPKTKTSTLIDGMVQVYIPAGEFWMGSEEGNGNEELVHEVNLDAYWLDEHEVTLDQYHEFMKETGCEELVCGESEDYPVGCVSWYDAQTYCEWRGGRLPTEAEWEKAARGGLEGKKYPWGDEGPVCDDGAENGARFNDNDQCNYIGTAPVMSYTPNGYGLYDMTGNVMEWASDWYDKDYYASSPSNNPDGPSSGTVRVLRGGSWYYDADFVRTAYRDGSTPDDYHPGIGFRCATSE